MPDGRYRVRLTVDDTPGNVEGAHGRAARESDPFALDRTPPVMDVRTSTANRVDVVRIDASDPGGAVASLEYSLDGGAWQSVEPADGVHDGPRESYRIELSRGASEVTRKLALRITDRSGNVSGVWRMLGDEARKGSSDGQ